MSSPVPKVSEAEASAFNALITAVRVYMAGPSGPDVPRQLTAVQVQMLRAARDLVALWDSGQAVVDASGWHGGPALVSAVHANGHLDDRELDSLVPDIGVDDTRVLAALAAHGPVLDAIIPVFNNLSQLAEEDRLAALMEGAAAAGMEFERREWIAPDGSHEISLSYTPPDERRTKPKPSSRTGGPRRR